MFQKSILKKLSQDKSIVALNLKSKTYTKNKEIDTIVYGPYEIKIVEGIYI